MNKWLILVILFAFTCISFKIRKVEIQYPHSWPKPVYDFESNSLDKSIIELGRKLFYDPILSRDSTISCASCHLSFTTFTHVDHALSHGIDDSIGMRNSPALINLAWQKDYMWDGAVNNLDVQALAPITHPAEMGETLLNVINKLTKHILYPSLFKNAFQSNEIKAEYLLKALAQFQLTFVSSNSKYDKIKRNETGYQFTEQEQNGYKLFKTYCNSCHAEPLFSSYKFENNGILLDSSLKDDGRYSVTLRKMDSLKFKVPTLRNIEYSFPYMHDGRFATLYQIMNHYSNKNFNHLVEDENPINQINLNEKEKIDLVSFLLTLGDREFTLNSNFQFPKE